MQAPRMAAAYALISILSATGGIAVLWPSMGWWSLASAWPVGGLSCLAAAALVGLTRSRQDLDGLADEMVSELRGVLAQAESPPAAGIRADAERRLKAS